MTAASEPNRSLLALPALKSHCPRRAQGCRCFSGAGRSMEDAVRLSRRIVLPSSRLVVHARCAAYLAAQMRGL